jgi:hypothetical protein
MIIMLYYLCFNPLFVDTNALAPEMKEKFIKVKENNELLQACVPGLAIAKLVTGTIPKEQNGKFVNFDIKF